MNSVDLHSYEEEIFYGKLLRIEKNKKPSKISRLNITTERNKKQH